MARYEVRLEAQDGSGHFRVTRLRADSAEDARKACERKELELVLYQLPEEDMKRLGKKLPKAADASPDDPVQYELPAPAPLDADDEDKAAFRKLEGADRARLAAHHQEQPYKVVSVDEVEERG